MSGGLRVLVQFAHPALERSRVQRRLLAAARGVAGVTINDLYELYPDFCVDVRREQALLAACDLLVLQHPFYWYSIPPLLKQWIDLVLEHGWAYGRGGTALAGKPFLCALSAGGGAESYRREGHNRFTVRELLAPVEQTARLCGMRPLAPFVVFGTHRLEDAALDAAARAWAAALTALRDGALDLERAAAAELLNPAPGALAGA